MNMTIGFWLAALGWIADTSIDLPFVFDSSTRPIFFVAAAGIPLGEFTGYLEVLDSFWAKSCLLFAASVDMTWL